MTSSDTTKRAAARKAPPYGLLIFVFLVAEATAGFELSMISVAIPHFIVSFHSDLVTVSWVVTAFILVGAGSAAIGGRLGDMYGRKRVLIALLLISAIGSILSLVVGTLPAVIAGRALQGTSAAVIPLLIGIARELFPAKKVATATAIITAVGTLSAGLGILVAGLLLDLGDWRYMFLASSILAVISVILSVFIVPRSTSVTTGVTFDWVGAILFVPSVAAIIFGFSSARAGWSPVVLGSIIIGAVVLAFWVWWEWRAESPIVNIRYLSNRKVLLTLATVGVLGLGAFSAFSIATPLLLLSPAALPIGLGTTATTYGIIGLGSSIVAFALAPVAGRIAARYGARTVAIIGTIIVVAVALALAVPALNKSLPVVAVAVFLTGIASMALISAVANLMVEAVPAANTSEFIGFASVVRNTCIALGTIIVSALLSSSVVPKTALPMSSAWVSAMIWVAVTAAIGLLFALLIRKDVKGVVEDPSVEAIALDPDVSVAR